MILNLHLNTVVRDELLHSLLQQSADGKME